LKRSDKETVVEELTGVFSGARAAFITDFQGLTVSKITDLRRKVGEAGGEYRVAKNTLMTRAVKDTPCEPITPFLQGNNALGTTEGDPVPLAKALVDYAKAENKLVIKCGVLNGQLLDLDQVKAMAELPSREVLLAKVLGAMNAVPAGFVRTLAAVPQNLVYALAAIRDQKQEAA
jgi:large subunit ribosomal protein L10